jgi:hypothetical protein
VGGGFSVLGVGFHRHFRGHISIFCLRRVPFPEDRPCQEEEMTKPATPKPPKPPKKAWNAAAPMKVPGKLRDLLYSHSPR